MTTTNYVRLVRDAAGTVIESHDADGEFKALREHIEQQAQLLLDMRELLANARQIALDAMDKTIKGQS